MSLSYNEFKVGDRAYFSALENCGDSVGREYIGKVGIVTEIIKDAHVNGHKERQDLIKISYADGDIRAIVSLKYNAHHAYGKKETAEEGE